MRKKTLLSLGLLTILVIGLVGLSSATADQHADLFPVTETSVQADGTMEDESVIWILPGPRSLDPDVFGTPDQPLMTNWLSERERSTNGEGNQYTTTVDATPFSNITEFIEGTIWANITDKTPNDGDESMDMANLEANFTDPMNKNSYYVKVKKVISEGSDHPFFGGVGTNVMIHGMTGIGQPLLPQVMAYSTVWAVGDLYINNSIAEANMNRLVHFMLTPRLRTTEFELEFGVADPDQLEVHLVLPPTQLIEGRPADKAVQTNYTLPNGQSQPFLHVNFYNINASSIPEGARAQTTTTIIESTLPTITITPNLNDGGTGATTGTKTFGFTGLAVLMSLAVIIPAVKRRRND